MAFLIDTIINFWTVAFLLRWFEKPLNLSFYHQLYQFVVKITSPVIRLFGGKTSNRYAALWGIFFTLGIKTFFYMSNVSDVRLAGIPVVFARLDLLEALIKSCLSFLLFSFKGLSGIFIIGILVDYEKYYDDFFRIIALLATPFEKMAMYMLAVFGVQKMSFRYRRLFCLVFLSFVFAMMLYLVLFIARGRIDFDGTSQITILKFFCLNLLMVVKIFDLFVLLLFVRAIASWIASPYQSKALQVIYIITDDLVIPFEKLNLRVGMIDFSLMVALIVWQIFIQLATSALISISQML